MKKILQFSLLFFGISYSVFAQKNKMDWFITANANLYLPVNNPQKTPYPIFWYDGNETPKIKIGGFGIGVGVFKELREKVSLKGQANFSKHAYYSDPLEFRDFNGISLFSIFPRTADYTMGLTATLHYFLSPRFSVGTGLGGQFLFYSITTLPKKQYFYDKELKIYNHQYKPFLPTLPVELSLKFEKTFFCIRYEYGLLNRIKGDLSKYETDKYGLLTFEMGFRFK